jgi:hypothetical protein
MSMHSEGTNLDLGNFKNLITSRLFIDLLVRQKKLLVKLNSHLNGLVPDF